MAELTPMRKQYLQIHEQHPDCLLFFRLGDFYEMFDEDAVTAARELDLTLTTRDRGKAAEERTPMCGVPYHSAEGYIARLVAKGYKVAICEQMEDPALAKGLVDRDVIRIITPATVVESSMLEEHKNNYYASVYVDQAGDIGAALVDISTGEALATLCTGADAREKAFNELGRFEPRELLVNLALAQVEHFTLDVQVRLGCAVNVGQERIYDPTAARSLVAAQFDCDLSDLPEPVMTLMQLALIRAYARRAGFASVTVRDGKTTLVYDPSARPDGMRLLAVLSSEPNLRLIANEPAAVVWADKKLTIRDFVKKLPQLIYRLMHCTDADPAV